MRYSHAGSPPRVLMACFAGAAGVKEAGWTVEAAGGLRFSLLLDHKPAPPTAANLRRFLGSLLKQLQASGRLARSYPLRAV